ncbi:TetR/AcrR family transcriptional regulator [Clostridium butyricum]|uniref:TetR/AcrR family transcriptional regulator n=1 Tax=Clostridium butyricum TaxID=1492 RepID=UPI0022E7ECF5|nr:TetR/AcrR family transcriptional regulator [Clostridium butyricum]
MKKKEDRRILYTRMVIKESFLSLIQEKLLDKITIKEICEKADINRATFYYHYTDLPTLLTAIETENAAHISDLVKSCKESGKSFLDLFLELIYTNQNFYKAFYNCNLGSGAIKIMLSQLHEQYILKRSCLNNPLEEMQAQYQFQFIKYGFIGVMRKWLSEGCIESPENIAHIIRKILNNNPQMK